MTAKSPNRANVGRVIRLRMMGSHTQGYVPSVTDLRAVFQQTFDELAYEHMPSLLKPTKGKLGLQDHEKVFCVDHKGAGDIFEMRGVDRERGCMVVVRPDQYVAHILPLNGYEELTEFFAGILLPAGEPGRAE